MAKKIGECENVEPVHDLVVKYWGVRGSIPTPLNARQLRKKQVELLAKVADNTELTEICEEAYQQGDDLDREAISKLIEKIDDEGLALKGTYGGNTTCIEVQARNSPLIVIDAGTGIRELGNVLLGRIFSGENLNPLDENVAKDNASLRNMHLFFTHYHWDHLQGFPFFAPAFLPMPDKKLNINFYGKRDARENLSDVLIHQQQYPNFPVVWGDMPCGKYYHEMPRLESSTFQVGDAKVTYQELTHPDSVFAYRIELAGKSFVCATDTEHKDTVDPRLVKLAAGADILYYDAQYTPEEYIGEIGVNKFDWGHSTYEWAVKNALAADVGTVVLGHHDPAHDDFMLDEIARRAKNFRDEQLSLPENKGKELGVIMAYDGLEQRIL